MGKNTSVLLHRVIVSLIAAAGICIVVLASQAQTKAAHAASAQGKQLFSAYCASCHGLDGHGGERAPDIARSSKLQNAPDPEISKIIRQGIPGTGMPGFAGLGEAKIQSLLRHLRALQGMDSAAAMPGSPEAGKALFFGKAGCSECHTASGRGGFLGSDLSAFARGKSAADLRIAITSPSLDHGKVVVVTTQDGAHFNGIVRNEDNFSLQLQTRDGTFHFFDKSAVQQIERRPEPLMPTDYGTRLTGPEINDIVSYLIQLARSAPPPNRSEREPVGSGD